MRNILLSILLISLISMNVHAQRSNGLIGSSINSTGSLIFSLGPAYCFGDTYAPVLNSSIFDGHNFQGTLGFQQSIGKKGFGYRAQIHYLNFTGHDIPTPPGESIKGRVHSKGFENFVSNTFEVTVREEYSLEFGAKYKRVKPHEVYGFLGLGALLSQVSFPPVNGQINYIGKTPIFGLFIPFGVGYKYQLNPKISIGVEITPQIVFTDYVDGYVGSHIDDLLIVNDNIGSLSFTFYYKLY